MNGIQFIWHQFLHETRQHLRFIVGFSFIVLCITIVNSTSILETTTDRVGRSVVPGIQLINLLLTLVPASLIIPFLVFNDPVDAHDSFWRSRPISGSSMAMAKIFWIAIWLIGLPCMGECITILSLGGVSKLPYIAIDFIGLRAMIFMMVFALATLANQPFSFVIGLVVSFLSLVVIVGVTHQFIDRPPLPLVEEVSIVNKVSAFVILGSISVAVFRYQWKQHFIFGISQAMIIMLVATILYLRPAPAVNTSSIMNTEPFSKLELILESAEIKRGHVTIDGLEPSRLNFIVLLRQIPPLGSAVVREIELSIPHENGEVFKERVSRSIRISNSSEAIRSDTFKQPDNNLVLQNNLENQLQGDAISQMEPAYIHFSSVLPVGLKLAVNQVNPIKIITRVDCFQYDEFGRFSIRNSVESALKGNKHPAPISFENEGTRIFLKWSSNYAQSNSFTLFIRHLSASMDPENLDLIAYTPLWQMSQWHFVFRNSLTGEVMRTTGAPVHLMCHNNPWSAIHLDHASLNGPSSSEYDEIVCFRASYAGQVTLEVPMTDILSN